MMGTTKISAKGCIIYEREHTLTILISNLTDKVFSPICSNNSLFTSPVGIGNVGVGVDAGWFLPGPWYYRVPHMEKVLQP